jgi:ferredoxin--NADP+ reductase
MLFVVLCIPVRHRVTVSSGEFAMPKWCPGVISEKKVWSQGLFTLQVDAPEVEPFLPGQFLHLGVQLPNESETEPKIINRPYSVASPHSTKLEFFIVTVDDGELTPRLWQLNAGDSVVVSQRAAGSFTLKKAPPLENLWLFATGTGLAPYIAMIRDPFVWQQHKRVFIIHGVRTRADLAYTEEMLDSENKMPGRFKMFQTLSRETTDNCLTGRITDILENGILEEMANVAIEPENSTVMLCGNPAMLDSMELLLHARGLRLHRSKSPGNIVLERYW